MSTFVAPVVVEFSSGECEWMARIPRASKSPATARTSSRETYAYDFLQVDGAEPAILSTRHLCSSTCCMVFAKSLLWLGEGWSTHPATAELSRRETDTRRDKTVNLFSDLRVAFNNARDV